MGLEVTNWDMSARTIPATAAERRVEMAPVTKAERESLAMEPARVGPRAPRTAMLVPTEPRLAKPQRA